MLFPQIRGTPWTTDYRDRRIDVTNLDTFFDVKDENNPQFTATVQQSLQQGTNCTFYLCYKQRRTDSDQLGRTSPVSCVIPGKSCACTHTHTHTHTEKRERGSERERERERETWSHACEIKSTTLSHSLVVRVWKPDSLLYWDGTKIICRDGPEKNWCHIKRAQMTRSKCLC